MNPRFKTGVIAEKSESTIANKNSRARLLAGWASVAVVWEAQYGDTFSCDVRLVVFLGFLVEKKFNKLT